MNNSSERNLHTPSLLVEEHGDKINACISGPEDRIRKTSLACWEADKALRLRPAKRQLVSLLPFGMRVFSQYVHVGSDRRLMDPGRRYLWLDKLPPMYELHKLSDDELTAFEASGLWTAALRRSDVLRWKKRGSDPELRGAFYAALMPRRSLASTEISRLDASLADLARHFDMEVVYPTAESEDDNYGKALRLMRKTAKKLVADDIRKRRKRSGFQVLRPELRKYAGFSSDEVEIEIDADEDRILEVLGVLGREDEFETIRKAAFNEYPVEGPPVPEWVTNVADKPPPAEALAADIEDMRQQRKAAKPSLFANRKTILAQIK